MNVYYQMYSAESKLRTSLLTFLPGKSPQDQISYICDAHHSLQLLLINRPRLIVGSAT